MLNFPVKVLLEFAGWAMDKPFCVYGEAYDFPVKMVVPLKTSLFSVCPGQPFDQLTVTLVRWMITPLLLVTVMLKPPEPVSVIPETMIFPQLSVGVMDGV